MRLEITKTPIGGYRLVIDYGDTPPTKQEQKLIRGVKAWVYELQESE